MYTSCVPPSPTPSSLSLQVILETHVAWQGLIAGGAQADDIDTSCVAVGAANNK